MYLSSIRGNIAHVSPRRRSCLHLPCSLLKLLCCPRIYFPSIPPPLCSLGEMSGECVFALGLDFWINGGGFSSPRKPPTCQEQSRFKTHCFMDNVTFRFVRNVTAAWLFYVFVCQRQQLLFFCFVPCKSKGEKWRRVEQRDVNDQ